MVRNPLSHSESSFIDDLWVILGQYSTHSTVGGFLYLEKINGKKILLWESSNRTVAP